MFSLHKTLFKKSIILTLLWFLGMGLFCFNVSQETNFNGLRLLPLLRYDHQDLLWKLSANISNITLHSHPHPLTNGLWFSIFAENFATLSGLSLVFLLLSLVPYAYFQVWALCLMHWLYYELYMNLLHIGVLDPRNFLVEASDFKLSMAVFSLSYCFCLSLWLTGEISASLQGLKRPPIDEGTHFIKVFFNLLLRFHFPMIAIASIIMSF